jgi:hypothetical protein
MIGRCYVAYFTLCRLVWIESGQFAQLFSATSMAFLFGEEPAAYLMHVVVALRMHSSDGCDSAKKIT